MIKNNNGKVVIKGEAATVLAEATQILSAVIKLVAKEVQVSQKIVLEKIVENLDIEQEDIEQEMYSVRAEIEELLNSDDFKKLPKNEQLKAKTMVQLADLLKDMSSK